MKCLMASWYSFGVTELQIAWVLRNDFLKVECSRWGNKSKVKRKQEWSYQQCNLVWYRSETIVKILLVIFLPSIKPMLVKQAYLGQSDWDRRGMIVFVSTFQQDFQIVHWFWKFPKWEVFKSEVKLWASFYTRNRWFGGF